jgi:hypothetical protein
MIGGLVRGAWLRYTRQQNLYVLGETADQNEFLLGSDVDNLAVVRPVLMDQRGRCFYCRGALTPAKRFWEVWLHTGQIFGNLIEQSVEMLPNEEVCDVQDGD